VAQFVEKPDLASAQRYLESGDYLWNGGIFLMRADVWLKEIGAQRPDILTACRAAYQSGKVDADFFRIDRQQFATCPSDSIDYAVMEKTQHAAVVPLDAGWSDIGAWLALWQVCEHDADGNVTQGDVLAHTTRNSLVIAQHRLVATVGLDDVIVVETPDAVLVASKERAQDVREIVNRLKGSGRRTEHLIHRRVYRPWGSYEGIDAGERFQVKRLNVKPGAALSLQMHHHRAEHWVVVKGTARVTRGDEVFILTENQSTYIPLGTKHRLENPGNIALEIIEVQSGAYLGEDDIVRFEDVYNRHKQ
jgi:mannose-1-phosphate guanylyltransferase/mannose-6-phosphate isomerase